MSSLSKKGLREAAKAAKSPPKDPTGGKANNDGDFSDQDRQVTLDDLVAMKGEYDERFQAVCDGINERCDGFTDDMNNVREDIRVEMQANKAEMKAMNQNIQDIVAGMKAIQREVAGSKAVGADDATVPRSDSSAPATTPGPTPPVLPHTPTHTVRRLSVGASAMKRLIEEKKKKKSDTSSDQE